MFTGSIPVSASNQIKSIIVENNRNLPKREHTYRITDYSKLDDEQLVDESKRISAKLDKLKEDEYSIANLERVFGCVMCYYNLTKEMYKRFGIDDSDVRLRIQMDRMMKNFSLN